METIDMFYQIIQELINIMSYPFVRYIFFSFLAWSLFRFVYNSMKVALFSSMTTTKKEDKSIEQTEIYDPLDPNFYVDPYDDFRG